VGARRRQRARRRPNCAAARPVVRRRERKTQREGNGGRNGDEARGGGEHLLHAQQGTRCAVRVITRFCPIAAHFELFFFFSFDVWRED